MDSTILHSVSEQCGIVREFYDISGGHHRLDTEDERELLRALGIDVESEDSLHAWIEGREREASSLFLKPIYILTRDLDFPEIILRLPRGTEFGSLQLRCICESGEERTYPLERVDPREGVEGTGEAAAPVGWLVRLDPWPAYGIHRLQLTDVSRAATNAMANGEMRRESLLVVAPPKCYLPPFLERGKGAGISVQLYALRSGRNLGMGDFEDLRRLIQWSASKGMDVVGVSPIHALYPSDPSFISPYYPSSRFYLNACYAAPDRIPEWESCEAARRIAREGQSLANGDTIPYDVVIPLRFRIYEELFELFFADFSGGAPKTDRVRDFHRFMEEEGEDLLLHATYDALYEHFQKTEEIIGGWEEWPAPYRDPHGEAVRSFSRAYEKRIYFYIYLQWNARRQLDELVRSCKEWGVSLYLDLAIGAAPGGAEVWSLKHLYSLRTHIGAPPDAFAPDGQDWGISPLNPLHLQEGLYLPFVKMLRNNMIENGILRMDHVMGLFRLYWITSRGGGYIQYPYRDLLALLALESQKKQCLIIGEDLGTVPPEVREELQRRSVFSWRVLYFEREWWGFHPPENYPALSVSTVNTHDLATLAGYWTGEDIRLRDRLSLLGKGADPGRLLDERMEERGKLLQALREKGGLSAGNGDDPPYDDVVRSVYRFLASSGSRLVLASLHDLMGDLRQPNLPGTTKEYPNWSLRYGQTLEELQNNSAALEILQILAERDTSLPPSGQEK